MGDSTEDTARFERSAVDLVELLEGTMHVRLRETLARLEVRARGAERMHGDDERYPRGLAGWVEVLAIDLSDHLEKQERVIFPAVRRGLTLELTTPIRVMRRQHEDLLESLASIGAAVEAFDDALTVDVAPRWVEFRSDLDELEQRMNEQIETADSALFPQLCGY